MEKSTSKSFDFGSFITECLTFILACLMRPISAIKNKINDYSDVKTAGVLVILVSLCRMIINLLRSMISAIFVKQRNFLKGTTSLNVSFEGLKNLDYFNLIVKQFIGFIIVVAVVAGVYYIASCVMKKTVNYFKLVSITTVSFIPMFIAGFVSTIISYIYAPIGVFIVFASLVYSVVTFIRCINDEISFDNKDVMVYFQTVCLTVLFIITYYVLSNSISSMIGLGSLLK